MSLTPGTRLGQYEILGALGAGGMGEVYRARDTKLNRDVALKILPGAFASDPDRLARFRREAQVLASLNHPHIAQIHGFEDSVATHALVMELVEGPTLADLIGSGMAIREALAVARQIAEALEAAHERGIVHRDLKPANVKVRPDGTVKVLDFGLAKALGPEGTGAAADAMLSPTLTGRATQLGVILGTAAYMAPEQARGKTVDRRADMWAFGCVFFEMLTGRRTFGGDEISDVLAEVIKSEPDWAALPADTPPAIRRLLRRCLTKDPKDRQADASTARLDIDDALLPSEMASPIGSPPRARRRDRMMWSTALLVTAIAASVVTAFYYRRALTAVQAPPEARLHIIVPPMPDNAFFSISPDGRSVVFEAAAERGQGDQLWLRPLDRESAKALPGTESVFDAAWSPDSGSLAFLANQRLKRIDLASLAVQTLADAATPRGVSWGADGTILFAPGGNGPLYRISAAGGRPEPATALRSTREASHRDPRFLPDGRHFLVWVLGEAETRGEYVGSLGSTEVRRLFDADGPADVAPPDHLLFVREGVLYAQRFDMRTLEPAGEPVPVAANVFASPTEGTAVSASSAGPIAYRTATGARQQLLWLDRGGKQTSVVGEPLTDVVTTRLSPDGRYVALSRETHGKRDIWLMDLARGTLRRLTFDGGNRAAWSPDGSQIVFNYARKGLSHLYRKAVGTSEPDQLLFESSEAKNVHDWSPDGRVILFSSQNPKTARDLWALPLDGDRKPFVIVQTPAEETAGAFSPDGKWIAYESNETGRTEVYVRPFPGPGRAWPISTSGGQGPQWRHDGKEVFYVSAGRLIAVPITIDAGSAVDAGNPVALFAMRAGSSYAGLSPDGQRFLVSTPLEDISSSPITVILNWAGRTK